MVPRMLEILPPVTRARMLDVGRPELLRKLAVVLMGTLKLPKLWNTFPPPHRVPFVMSIWVWPLGSESDRTLRYSVQKM